MGKGPSGLANAALRAVGRLVRAKRAARPSGVESRRAIASREGAFTILERQVLPSVDERPAGWLAGAYGYPAWLVERWLARFGPTRAERMLEWGNTPPTVCCRLNPLRLPSWPLTDVDAARVFEGCATFRPGDVPGSYRIDPQLPPGELPGFAGGLFTIQDETQIRPARALGATPGARVLDLCAGLGGKTTQLAELVGPGGHVVAVEADEAKIAKARAAADRLGLTNVTFVHGDARDAQGPAAGEFEFVLLDAPCSNLGALDRRPEVRLRATEEAIGRLAALERALLEAACARTAPGGTLVYSVCTTEEEETSAVVREALGQDPGCRLQTEYVVLPVASVRDGGYCARISRAPADTEEPAR
jgi:16S rRNA (cytosine967-C5)-methyltransferase